MVDDWRRQQTDLPSRAEAIRRLVELGATGLGAARKGSRPALRMFLEEGGKAEPLMTR
jgi:hypothetical protein